MNNFKVTFADKDRSFTTTINEQKKNFSPKVDPGRGDPEEIAYDEIVIYDGGGVDGYGDD